LPAIETWGVEAQMVGEAAGDLINISSFSGFPGTVGNKDGRQKPLKKRY